MYRIVNKQNSQCYDPIYGGIRIQSDNTIIFNWNKDDKDNDTILLCENSSGTYNEDGVRYFYGYQFVKNADKSHKKQLRDYLKGKIDPSFLYTEDVEKFVERSIFALDRFDSLDNYSATVCTKATHKTSVLNVMRSYLMEYGTSIMTEFELVKEMYKNVQFDISRARNALINARYSKQDIQHEINFIVNKFNELKESGELFQIKRFLPKEIRAGFFNFLKFQSDYDKNLYRNLQNVNVLLYDDFLTSGNTVKEMIRVLKSIHDRNRLTVFVLIKK